ncbi:receptor-interacting serine/threonine-protein kinase 4-like [Trichogramma pretiosum]|uniref:receptor-interacting serine/threonine-protein kinase 4-like n=1 Tax=Trichogramma pretiosum TaxID=7493 RepID=UPI000C71B844|nr:receptor-interacting serine/threonine-protein kinase 4-like [Trichogramma pretiosum]
MERFDKIKELKAAIEKKTEEERDGLRLQLYSLTSDWLVQLPIFREVFQPEEIDWLLLEAAKKLTKESVQFIKSVARSGYKDGLKHNEDGNRTTAVHYAADKDVLKDLFVIYNRCDVNYVDESTGVSHFHVACEFGFGDVAKKFLDHGVDLKDPWPASGDSPLHLAVEDGNRSLIELVLKRGANVNSSNIYGMTPVHIIASTENEDLATFFFKICDDLQLTVQIDARDAWHNTPLHVALKHGNQRVVELLLRRGANPNLIGEEGKSPLHLICERASSQEELLAMFPRLA